MHKQPGQSLAEYAIVIALIALVCIPALTLLGDNLKNGMENIASTVPTSAPTALVANAPGASSGTPASVAGGIPTTPSTQTKPAVQSSYDPKTGQITYQLPASSGGGTNTASVEGAANEISAQLIALTNTWKDANGQPMDPSLKSFILALATSGKQIALSQADIKSWDGTQALTDSIPVAGIFTSIGTGIVDGIQTNDNIAKAQDFVAKYKQLDAMLASNPEKYAELKQTIDAYSGIISYVNYDNFVKDSQPSMQQNIVVGTNPEVVVPVENSSSVTTTSANGIQNTATDTNYAPQAVQAQTEVEKLRAQSPKPKTTPQGKAKGKANG